MRIASTSTGAASASTVIGLLALAAYGVPLFFPPHGSPLAVPLATATLLERLFPGVPPLWVALRLGALAFGAILLARGLPAPTAPAANHVRTAQELARPAVARFAFALALAGALGALRIHASPPAAQALFLFALPIPALLLAWAHRTRGVPNGLPVGSGAGPTALVIACWSLLAAATAIYAPRAASTLDTWLGFIWLHSVIAGGKSLFAHNVVPGLPDYYLVLQGAGLGALWDFRPSFPFVQATQILWSALAAAGVGYIASRHFGRATAPLATAVMLFSPYMMAMPFFASAWPVAIVLGVGLLTLLLRFRESGSAASIVGLGTLAGFSLPLLWITPLAGLTVLLGGALAWRRRLRPLYAATAAFCLFAAMYPGLPERYMLNRMLEEFAQRHTQVSSMQAIIFGQRSVLEPPGFDEIEKRAGIPGALDIQIGTLLAPAAIARTPMRLWNDSMLEPIGTALGAIGVVAALQALVRHPVTSISGPGLALAFLGLSLATGMTSSYDVPALGRIPFVPAAAGGLAAFAARGIWLRWNALHPYLWTVAAMLSGSVLFHVVAPQIMPTSALEIIVRQIRDADPPQPTRVLVSGEKQGLGAMEADWMLPNLLSAPIEGIAVSSVDNPFVTSADDFDDAAVLFWTPAVEKELGFARLLCARWPTATLHILYDRPGLSRAFAARRATATWQPAGPATQWRRLPCGSQAVHTLARAAERGQLPRPTAATIENETP